VLEVGRREMLGSSGREVLEVGSEREGRGRRREKRRDDGKRVVRREERRGEMREREYTLKEEVTSSLLFPEAIPALAYRRSNVNSCMEMSPTWSSRERGEWQPHHPHQTV
jgi:hypothetical protein